MDKKEQTRLRVKRYREKKDSVTLGERYKDSVTPDGTYFKDGIEMVSASYVEGKEGKLYEFLPERPRHLILSDGQALDRAAQPKTKKTDRGMVASNEAFSYVKDKGRALRYKLWKEGRVQTHPAMYTITEGRKKLETIVKSLKSHNQLHNVNLGAGRYSLPLDVVGEMLDATQ